MLYYYYLKLSGGLLQFVANQLLCHAPDRAAGGSGYQKLKSLGMSHIGDPMRQLARAGLDLLSFGLNRFGLSAAPVSVTEPEPTDRNVIIIFVVGGVSATEIEEIQGEISKLNEFSELTQRRIILGSNNIIATSDIYKIVYS